MGGGTGMMCLGFKGGTGTSSRIVKIKDYRGFSSIKFWSEKNLTIFKVLPSQKGFLEKHFNTPEFEKDLKENVLINMFQEMDKE